MREPFQVLTSKTVTLSQANIDTDQIIPARVLATTRREGLGHHSFKDWRWLAEGAYFYVCGDASRMAKDVDTALHRIVEEQGGRSPEEAAAYVEEMKKAKRYRKDVY
jgi:hypothetical protein